MKMFKLVKNLNIGKNLTQRFQSQLATYDPNKTVIDTNKQNLIVNPLQHDDFFQIKSLIGFYFHRLRELNYANI